VHGEQPAFLTGSEVTPEYFRLLGMNLEHGRLFDDFDSETKPLVAVVNEAMARAYWPNENPIGKRMRLSRTSPEWTTVVGVVADARTESLASSNVPHLYASLYQQKGKHLAIFLRGHVDTRAIAHEVRDAVQSVNSALPGFGVETLNETVSASLAVRRFSMELIALFALTALLLAALGIYGVISYMVSERTHEIGVRMAMGARAEDVLALILRQGLTLTAVGVVAGIVFATLMARLMRALLFGVSTTDVPTYAAVVVLLGLVALVACLVPARRATRLDPVFALRGE
jgi:putative ABC transport system permease protein